MHVVSENLLHSVIVPFSHYREIECMRMELDQRIHENGIGSEMHENGIGSENA